jgi:hypothetical protein
MYRMKNILRRYFQCCTKERQNGIFVHESAILLKNTFDVISLHEARFKNSCKIIAGIVIT